MAKKVEAYECLDGTLTMDHKDALGRDGKFLTKELLGCVQSTDTEAQKVECLFKKVMDQRAAWAELFAAAPAAA